MAAVPKRCVHLDWYELYLFEGHDVFPCNADYFRSQGYFVREREYGTRQYQEMFTIEDAHGEPWIEVRRNPASGNADFLGYVPESCNLRLVNRYCYSPTAIPDFNQFLLKHHYVFQRIFRIDICYDFTHFDYGDKPEDFARRYIAQQYRKVNQSKVAIFGEDQWAEFQWQSLSWGNKKSMVSTKMYDKTVELKANKNDKPYIRMAWVEAGLIDHPVEQYKLDAQGNKSYPHVWRIEFSMRSKARHWLVIESQAGKHQERKKIPHLPAMFDSPEKLWDRFEELAYHYFRFHHKTYKNVSDFLFQNPKDKSKPHVDLEVERKDRSPEKKLFKFNTNREFHQLQQMAKVSKPDLTDQILLRRLQYYHDTHFDTDIRKACVKIIENIKAGELRRCVEDNDPLLLRAMQMAFRDRLAGDTTDYVTLYQQIYKLLQDGSIF